MTKNSMASMVRDEAGSENKLVSRDEFNNNLNTKALETTKFLHREMAEMLQITQSAFSQRVKNSVGLSSYEMFCLARDLNVPLNFFLPDVLGKNKLQPIRDSNFDLSKSMDEFNEDLFNNVFEFCDLTQTDVAKILKCTPSNISQRLSGGKAFKPYEQYLIAADQGMPLDGFLPVR